MKLTMWPIAILLLVFHSVALPHHSTSAYDLNEEVSIQGMLVRIDWANPHTYFWVEEAIDAEQVIWEVEGSPAAYLRRHGWTRETLRVGDRLTVRGNPGRDPEKPIMVMRYLQQGDTVLDRSLTSALASLTQKDAAIAERATSLSGTWGTIFDQAAILQFSAPWTVELTDEGRAAAESFEREPAIAQCAPDGIPRAMLSPDIKMIEVRDETVLISREWDGVERTVYMNVDSHDGAVESIQGHSIGHWEGGVLVIDTARFTPQRSGNGIGLPSGAGKHLVERLELNEDGSRLTYAFEVEDPQYLAEPIVGEQEWAYRPDLEYVGLPCDAGSASRFLNQ
jgi:hypothetical protein